MRPATDGLELSSIYHLLKSPLATGPDVQLQLRTGYLVETISRTAVSKTASTVLSLCFCCTTVTPTLANEPGVPVFVAGFLVENALEEHLAQLPAP